jgi:hypothetical protein
LWCRKAAVFAVGNSSETKEKVMSDNTKTNETTGSKPSHIAYQVRDVEGRKSFWNRIGSAWMHKDGNGFQLQLESVPLDGRIVLRIATEKKE